MFHLYISQFDSENIVAYKGAYATFKKLWIVMEHCGGGSICDIMTVCDTVLPEAQVAAVIKMCLKGLAYMHKQRKIHRVKFH